MLSSIRWVFHFNAFVGFSCVFFIVSFLCGYRLHLLCFCCLHAFFFCLVFFYVQRHGNGYAPPSYPNVSPYPGFAGPRPMAPMAVGAGGLLGGLGTVLGAAAMGKAVLNPVSIAIDEVDEVAENRKITRTFLVH